jgi:hypothetical protein
LKWLGGGTQTREPLWTHGQDVMFKTHPQALGQALDLGDEIVGCRKKHNKQNLIK